MSDLISRSKVISVLEQLEEHSLSGKMNISNAIYLLDMQPIAYDVDKVVAKLEKKRDKLSEEGCCLSAKQIKDAIKIVKAGGNS